MYKHLFKLFNKFKLDGVWLGWVDPEYLLFMPSDLRRFNFFFNSIKCEFFFINLMGQKKNQNDLI